MAMRLQRAKSALFAAWFAGVSITLSGCKPKDIAIEPPGVAADAPTREQLIAAHNARVANLATTHSDGVVILSWKDDRGDHTDQGDIEFFQTAENQTALRVSDPVGEVRLWLGSNDREWWLFDLINGDRKTLFRGTHDQLGERLGAIGVKPLALLDVLGLTRIDESTDAAAPILDEKRNAWIIEANGRGGRLKYAFDRKTLLPSHIELIGAEGEVQAESDLSRWESVAVEGVAVMARPKMPLTIVIRRAGEDAAVVVGEVKISLNQTVSTIDERSRKSIFDLDRLTQSMRPEFIEHAGAASQ